MSGLEVIGAIASVSQLVQYTTTLIINLQELYRNVERSGERCTLYREQINQLIQIVDLINSFEDVLRSEAITAHVRALVRTTETIEEALRQGCVGDISRVWKKCLKAWKWNKAEETILKGFADLERDKSCLTLCILAAYGRLISRIDRNIEDGLPQIQEQARRIERTLSTCSTILKEGDRIKDDSTVLNEHTCPHHHGLRMHKANGDNKEKLVIRGVQALQTKAQNHVYNGSPNNRSESPFGVERRNAEDRDSGYGSPPESVLTDEAPPSTGSWSGNVVFDEAMQINGNVGRKDAVDAALTNCRWSQNEARDNSKQVNGEILDAKFAAIFFCRAQTMAA